MDQIIEILNRASRQERKGLRRILDTVVCENSTPGELVKGLTWLHRNVFEDVYRDLFNEPETYQDIVKSVCKKLGVESKKRYPSNAELETLIAAKVMGEVWEKMTPEQREKMEKEIAKVAESYGREGEWVKVGGLGGAIVAAELGGFATFTMATSSLAAVSGVAGVTLPFVAYSTLTSTMGVLLGPVGWIGLGIFAAWKISGPNYKKLIPAILYISMLRNKPDEEPRSEATGNRQVENREDSVGWEEHHTALYE